MSKHEDAPKWMREFLENACAALELGAPGHVGWNWVSGTNGWEAWAYPMRVEMVGGRYDGEALLPGHRRVDLSEIAKLFDSPPEMSWSHCGDETPEVSMEGQVEGQTSGFTSLRNRRTTSDRPCGSTSILEPTKTSTRMSRRRQPDMTTKDREQFDHDPELDKLLHDPEMEELIKQEERLEAAEERCESLCEKITAQGPVRVATIDLHYEPGSYVAWNGVKGGGPRGYGWDSAGIPSQYFLIAMGPEGEVAVRIDRIFKQGIGRLTPKRRDLIRRTMPPTVTLVVGDDPWYGKDHVLVSSDDLARWLEVVKAILPAANKRAGPKSAAS